MKLRFRFSLRTFLVATGLLAIIGGMLASRINRARQQRAAVLAIDSDYEIPWVGIWYGDQLDTNANGEFTSEESWERSWIDELLHDVAVVQLSECEDTRVLDDIGQFPQLSRLDVCDCFVTKQTVDWSVLSRLTNLRVLRLKDVPFADSDCQYLTSLTNLEMLSLEWTQVTDRAISDIAKLDWLVELDLSHTEITDEAVSLLSQMHNLTQLDLRGNFVSESISELQEHLPNCTILWDRRPDSTASADDPFGRGDERYDD
jgi:hypothetical protein